MQLLFDELSQSIQIIQSSDFDDSVPKLKLQTLIVEALNTMSEELFTTFIHNNEEDLDPHSINDQVKEYVSLDKDSTISIIFSPLTKEHAFFSNLFRFVHKLRRSESENLEDFHPLLVAPVLLSKELSLTGLNDFEIKQKMDSLYYCANWFRFIL